MPKGKAEGRKRAGEKTKNTYELLGGLAKGEGKNGHTQFH